jgi:hypothetical protein
LKACRIVFEYKNVAIVVRVCAYFEPCNYSLLPLYIQAASMMHELFHAFVHV